MLGGLRQCLYNMTETLTFPKKLFKKSFGVGIDSGGSCFKLAYTTEHGDNLHVHLARYPKGKYQDALKFLKTTCGQRMEADVEVITCGISTGEQIQDIGKLLNVRAKNTWEISPAVVAFKFLIKYLPWTDVIINPRPGAVRDGIARARCSNNIVARLYKGDDSVEDNSVPVPDEPESPPEIISYPIMLTMSGSASAYAIVKEDMRYEYKTWNPFGGSAFLGLGGYIADTKSYEDLLSMMLEGDPSQIDMLVNSVGGGDQVYTTGHTVQGMTAFGFGHLVEKTREEVSKKDVVSALLSAITHCIAREACLWAALHNVSQVFCIGSLPCSSTHIQDSLTTHFEHENNGPGMPHRSHHYFVKHGSYLGAIGCLLANLEVVESP